MLITATNYNITPKEVTKMYWEKKSNDLFIILNDKLTLSLEETFYSCMRLLKKVLENDNQIHPSQHIEYIIALINYAENMEISNLIRNIDSLPTELFSYLSVTNKCWVPTNNKDNTDHPINYNILLYWFLNGFKEILKKYSWQIGWIKNTKAIEKLIDDATEVLNYHFDDYFELKRSSIIHQLLSQPKMTSSIPAQHPPIACAESLDLTHNTTDDKESSLKSLSLTDKKKKTSLVSLLITSSSHAYKNKQRLIEASIILLFLRIGLIKLAASVGLLTVIQFLKNYFANIKPNRNPKNYI